MRRRAVGLIYTVHDLSRGTVTSVSDPLVPSPTAGFLLFSPRVFGRVAVFDLRRRDRVPGARVGRGGTEKRRKSRGTGPAAQREGRRRSDGDPLSFISSHFRQSPRYSAGFTAYSIYRGASRRVSPVTSPAAVVHAPWTTDESAELWRGFSFKRAPPGNALTMINRSTTLSGRRAGPRTLRWG